jgi:hypothetical protein
MNWWKETEIDGQENEETWRTKLDESQKSADNNLAFKHIAYDT